MIEILKVTRTYGGLEGRRIKAGTKLAVGGKHEDLQVITAARANQLKNAGLAQPWTPEPAGAKPAAPPRPNYAANRGAVVHQPIQTGKRAAAAHKKKAPRGAEAPAEPRPLENPASGQTGETGSSALSPEDQASKKSTLGLRGTRGSRRLPLTTASASPPGPPPSTPATRRGGGSTKNKPAPSQD